MPSTNPAAVSGSLPAIPGNSSVRRLQFGLDALGAIADELGRPLTIAPFQVQGAAVHRILVPVVGGAVVPGTTEIGADAAVEMRPVTLTFWTSLQRVDVVGPWVSVVATGVIAVDLVAGVEAIFRYPGGSVTVARNGRVMVRTGPDRDHPGEPVAGGRPT